MTQSTNVSPIPTADLEQHERLAALRLIAQGGQDEKLRYIAAHAPDFLVDHVLDWRVDHVSREAVAPSPHAIGGVILDAVIARIALGAQTPEDIRACA